LPFGGSQRAGLPLRTLIDMSSETFIITPDDEDFVDSAPQAPPSLRIAPYPLFSSVSVRGVKFAALSGEQCINHVLRELTARRGGTIITLNVDHLRRCGHDPVYRAMVDRAEVSVADGMPIVWASRLQRTPLPQRVAGSDLIDSLASAAAEYGYSVFLLGGNPGTAEATSKLLGRRYPHLRVAGWHDPRPGFEQNPQSVAATIDLLRQAAPDIVFVALGSPKQESFICSARQALPGAWWLGVGISFSFLCGEIRRAPLWMQRAGLEWVHRLAQEPGKLFRRYLVYGVPFAAKLLVTATLNGIFRPSRSDRAS
jgi:N-acetylglucosaminyldiphosphoundecaprenol N-acetyl-beta-D-mannosaminyltransferase